MESNTNIGRLSFLVGRGEETGRGLWRSRSINCSRLRRLGFGGSLQRFLLLFNGSANGIDFFIGHRLHDCINRLGLGCAKKLARNDGYIIDDPYLNQTSPGDGDHFNVFAA